MCSQVQWDHETPNQPLNLNPKRGVWYVFEGALQPWNLKPIPKLWDLGQTKAPVGNCWYVEVQDTYSNWFYVGL